MGLVRVPIGTATSPIVWAEIPVTLVEPPPRLPPPEGLIAGWVGRRVIVDWRPPADIDRVHMPTGADPADWLPTVPAGKVATFPRNTIVATRGVTLTNRDGVRVDLNGSVITLHAGVHRRIVELVRCRDVELVNGALVGSHEAAGPGSWPNVEATGRWNHHGVDLLGCEQVRIAGVDMVNVWADFVHMGRHPIPGRRWQTHGDDAYWTCRDILLEDCYWTGNGRQGLGVVSVIGGTYRRIRQERVTRTQIDIEPIGPGEITSDLLFEDYTCNEVPSDATKSALRTVSAWVMRHSSNVTFRRLHCARFPNMQVGHTPRPELDYYTGYQRHRNWRFEDVTWSGTGNVAAWQAGSLFQDFDGLHMDRFTGRFNQTWMTAAALRAGSNATVGSMTLTGPGGVSLEHVRANGVAHRGPCTIEAAA